MSHARISSEEIIAQLKRCHDKHGFVSPRVMREDDDFCSPSTVMKRFADEAEEMEIGPWLLAKRKAGLADDEDLPSAGRPQKFSNDDIKKKLQELEESDEWTVTVEDLSERAKANDDWPSPSVVIERFSPDGDVDLDLSEDEQAQLPHGDDDELGGWIRAKLYAGVQPDARTSNSRPAMFDTDEAYLNLLRECEDRYGKVTQRVFDDPPDDDIDFGITSQGIRKRFETEDAEVGGWQRALKLAGVIDDVEPHETYEDDEIMAMLVECWEEHGECTVSTFRGVDEFCSPETVIQRFGSWSEAKEQAKARAEIEATPSN